MVRWHNINLYDNNNNNIYEMYVIHMYIIIQYNIYYII